MDFETLQQALDERDKIDSNLLRVVKEQFPIGSVWALNTSHYCLAEPDVAIVEVADIDEDSFQYGNAPSIKFNGVSYSVSMVPLYITPPSLDQIEFYGKYFKPIYSFNGNLHSKFRINQEYHHNNKWVVEIYTENQSISLNRIEDLFFVETPAGKVNLPQSECVKMFLELVCKDILEGKF